MRSRILLNGSWIALLVVLSFGLACERSAPAPTPKADVSLHSSVDAIVPGEPFDVAFKFKMTEGWHIYWQNPGEVGLPPGVAWTMPEGFTAGALQYPRPREHRDGADLVSNILEGEPVLLMRITPPERVSSDNVTLAATVKYLICKDACIQESASVGLDLPVASSNEPANTDLFEQARAAIPKSTSRWLKVTASPSVAELKAGQEFDLLIHVDINPGIHIQGNQVFNKQLIPSRLLLERTPGVTFENPIYPKASIRTMPYVGRVTEFAGKIVVRVPAKVDEAPPPGLARFGGLFTFQACSDKGTCFPPETVAFSVTLDGIVGAVSSGETAREGAAAPKVDAAATTTGRVEAFLRRLGLPGLLLGCFLYGLVMNVTPCVLPLLSIKVLGFVQQAHESRRRTLMLGLSFGVGVMIFFIVLGFLAAQGRNVQHHPIGVIVLGTVVMVLALSMLGVYTLRVPTAATKLDASIQKEGLAASFGKGALAPVLGFACTGPLLAGIFGWAAQQDAPTAFAAFLVTGLGMASPYMLLGANPNWLSWLPKPGNWMITFERIMGFLLLVMVVYLLSPLVGQIGAEGLQWTLGFLVVVALACWVLGNVNLSMPVAARWRYRGGAAAIVVVAGVLIYGLIYPLGEAVAKQKASRLVSHSADDWSSQIPWQRWSKDAVANAVGEGKAVFVHVTAGYCTNCKTNMAVAINTGETRDKMKARGVIPFEADFSDGDPAIFALLRKYDRLGPPLDLLYAPGKPDDPVVLPVLFSQATLLEKLDEATREDERRG
jgi:thiol:disulfide interchange protein